MSTLGGGHGVFYMQARFYGERQTVRALKLLGENVAAKVLARAINMGATPIVQTARQIVRGVVTKSGMLARSIGRKSLKYKRRGVVMALVGPRIRYFGPSPPEPTQNRGVDAYGGFHGHLVEWGTKERWQKTTGRYTGRMPSYPFMQKAFLINQRYSASIVRRITAEGIRKEAAKLARRGR